MIFVYARKEDENDEGGVSKWKCANALMNIAIELIIPANNYTDTNTAIQDPTPHKL